MEAPVRGSPRRPLRCRSPQVDHQHLLGASPQAAAQQALCQRLQGCHSQGVHDVEPACTEAHKGRLLAGSTMYAAAACRPGPMLHRLSWLSTATRTAKMAPAWACSICALQDSGLNSSADLKQAMQLHPICELRAWLHQARIAQGADTAHCSSRPRSFTDMGLGLQIWDAGTRRCLLSMSSHSQAISAVRWGGEGLLYSASRDTVINVWDAQVPLPQSRLQWRCAHQLVLGWAGRCSSLVVGCQGSCVGVAVR